MASTAVLVVWMAAMGVFVIAAVVALFGHALWLRFEQARNRQAVAGARTALFRLLQTGGESVPDADRERALRILRDLPVSATEILFLSIAPSIDSTEHTPLSRIAREIGLLDRAEALCRSRFWWRRLHGARLLSLLGGGHEVMVTLFSDPDRAVRAQAIEWAAEDASPETVAGLVALLGDPAQSDLFTVQDAVYRTGVAAVPALREMLEQGEGAGTEHALRVGAALADPRLLPVAVRLCVARAPAVRAAAADLLGATGGHEGTDVLATLLDDSDAAVRAAAARALGRLRSWKSAPRLAARMRDTSWQVRRSAGLALRAVGPPGLLLLRKMLLDYNNFASDMAQHVLDMPGGVGDLGR